MTGLPKILFESSTFSCPCSERKDKNENYLKDTIPKTFFPGLVNTSFDIPADFLFQKSEKFCSFFEKMLQCKTVFFCKKNFLGKLLRWRKVQFWKQLKNFVTCPNCHRSNSENKHKLTTFPKSGPPHEPVDMLNADWRPCWSFFVRNPETFFLNYKNICENIVFLKAQNWFPQHPEMCLRINFYHKIIQKSTFGFVECSFDNTTLACINCKSPKIFNSKFESEEGFFLCKTNYSKCTSRYVQCSFDSQSDFFAKVRKVFAPVLMFWHR